MVIKITLLLVFFAVMVGIGLYCRRHATNVSGFVLGGRSVGPWLTAFAYGTSYFSAVVFVGYAGQFGWKYGIAATWAGIGNALLGSLLAWAVLGRRTRIMSQHLDSATMPEFFGKRFGSKSLKIAASASPSSSSRTRKNARSPANTAVPAPKPARASATSSSRSLKSPKTRPLAA